MIGDRIGRWLSGDEAERDTRRIAWFAAAMFVCLLVSGGLRWLLG